MAKKTYDQYYILNAKNPCKAAWSLVIEANSSKNEIKCAASPDEFNSFILRAVERISSPIIYAEPGLCGDLFGLPTPKLLLLLLEAC